MTLAQYARHAIQVATTIRGIVEEADDRIEIILSCKSCSRQGQYNYKGTDDLVIAENTGAWVFDHLTKNEQCVGVDIGITRPRTVEDIDVEVKVGRPPDGKRHMDLSQEKNGTFT